jgi:hypothetical protein
MSFFSHGLFVVAGIIAGSTAINYFVLGNGADYGLPNSRLGAWRNSSTVEDLCDKECGSRHRS